MERGAGRMGEEPAAIREGLQEAFVGALQEREDLRQEHYKAPRRAAGRHRLLGLSNLSGSTGGPEKKNSKE